MSEEKDPGVTSSNDRNIMRQELEEALAIWEDLGTELKRLLTRSALDEFSVGEIALKCEEFLSVVNAMTVELNSNPEKQYYKIGEVSEILKVEPYVINYWESEFKILKPSRTRARLRLYNKKDIEKLGLIKDLIYGEKFTIAGAKKRLREIQEMTDH
jgi:hypothetical protein